MKLRFPKLVLIGIIAAMPAALWAADAGDHGSDIGRLFLIFAMMLVVGKFSGELFERIGQPAVLGELIAGALLGSSVLGIIPTGADDPLTGTVAILAEIGVVVLLFEIGLDTDLKAMFRVGPSAAAVAVVGVILPMIGGVFFWLSPITRVEHSNAGTVTTAIFLGATLTATSVGITARVLADLKVMGSVESGIILGAAVIDDVLGLILLGLVSSLAVGVSPSAWGIGKTVSAAVGFLVLAVAVGIVVAPRIFGLVDRMRVRGVLLVVAFAFVLALSALAELAGSAMIIGAFAAGIILSETNQFDVIEQRIRPVADIFTPVFFLSIGAQFDVRLLNVFDPANWDVLAIGGALLVIAAIGKIATGWSVWWRRFNRPAVGFGMLPRGEVGLIFANIGLVTGVLTRDLFGAVILMVIGTTFMAPPLLKLSFKRWGVTSPPEPGPDRLSRYQRAIDLPPSDLQAGEYPDA